MTKSNKKVKEIKDQDLKPIDADVDAPVYTDWTPFFQYLVNTKKFKIQHEDGLKVFCFKRVIDPSKVTFNEWMQIIEKY